MQYDQVLPANPINAEERDILHLALWHMPLRATEYIRGSTTKMAVLGIIPLLFGWQRGGSPLLAAADG